MPLQELLEAIRERGGGVGGRGKFGGKRSTAAQTAACKLAAAKQNKGG